jgi:hypothetical protein
VNSLLDDGRALLLFDVPPDPLDELGLDRAHVVANITEPHRLDEGDQRLLLHTQFLRNLVNPDLTHRSSVVARLSRGRCSRLESPRSATLFAIITADRTAAAIGCDAMPNTPTSDFCTRDPSSLFVPHATAPPVAMACMTDPTDAALCASRATTS